MKQVLFVQGGGAGTHDAWDNKLVASLERALGPDYTIRYPRMPNEADPDPTAWKETIARELRTLSDGVFLVGHSVGAAILMDYLASGTEERRLAGVFLIATPFIGDGGWPSETLRPTRQVAVDLREGAHFIFIKAATMRPFRSVISRCSLRHFRTRRSAVWTVATISWTTTYLSSRTISGRNEGVKH